MFNSGIQQVSLGKQIWETVEDFLSIISFQDKKERVNANGLYIGDCRLTQETIYDHLLVVGANSSDKVSKFLIPALLHLDKQNVVVIDTKGLYQVTSGCFNSKGYKVKVLNLEDSNQSLRFNPLVNITHKNDYEFLARVLVSHIKEITLEETLEITKELDPERFSYIEQAEATDAFSLKRNLQKIWTYRVKKACEILIRSLFSAIKSYSDKANKPEELHLANIRFFLDYLSNLSNLDEDLRPYGVNKFMETNLTSDEELIHWEWFLGMRQRHEAYYQVILRTSLLALNLWGGLDAINLTSSPTNELEIKDKNKPTALYVIVPEDRLTYFAPLINLLLISCFEQSLNTKEGVYYFIDSLEIVKSFPNVDREGNEIEAFNIWLHKLAQKNCYVSLLVNNFECLAGIYSGKYSLNRLLSNFGYQLFLDDLASYKNIETEKIKNSKDALIAKRILTLSEIPAQYSDANVVIYNVRDSGNVIDIKESTLIALPSLSQNKKLHKLSQMPPCKVPVSYVGNEVSYLDIAEITKETSVW